MCKYIVRRRSYVILNLIFVNLVVKCNAWNKSSSYIRNQLRLSDWRHTGTDLVHSVLICIRHKELCNYHFSKYAFRFWDFSNKTWNFCIRHEVRIEWSKINAHWPWKNSYCWKRKTHLTSVIIAENNICVPRGENGRVDASIPSTMARILANILFLSLEFFWAFGNLNNAIYVIKWMLNDGGHYGVPVPPEKRNREKLLPNQEIQFVLQIASW